MEVFLYMYDLTQGMAAMMGPSLIGRPLEAIWHTSVVVYGTEYFFGNGVFTSVPVGFLLFFASLFHFSLSLVLISLCSSILDS